MIAARNQNGLALLVVLVVVALLAALLIEFSFSTMVDVRLTETFRDNARAYYLARGGIRAAQMILADDGNDYDSENETWAQDIINYPVEDGFLSISITDLDGRLAVNGLIRNNNPQTVVVDRFYRFFSALDLPVQAEPGELTAALIDWLDMDDDNYARIQTDGENLPVSGAESADYLGAAAGGFCKNAPLDSLEELLRIKGFSQEVYALVAPHLTANGRTKVNINTASPAVLMSLSPVVDDRVVETILVKRAENPVSDIAELEDFFPSQTYSALKSLANQNLLGTQSFYYRIVAEASVNDGRCRMIADVNKPNKQLIYLKVD